MQKDKSIVFSLVELAERCGSDYGKAIGTDTNTASRKLKSIFRAILSAMEIGEKELIPLLPKSRGSLVVKKLGRDKLSVSVQ